MALSRATEGRLEVQYRAGPTRAVGVLYERHANRILGFCLYQLGNRAEAEDAVQTTFLYALRALRRGVVPKNEIAWLVTIAHNVCRSLTRSSRRRHRVEAARDPHVIDEIAGRSDAATEELLGLDDALARIPENQRRAIVLREWQGLPYREIAATMGVTQTAVEMLVFRARRSLAGALRGERGTRVRQRVRRALDFGSVFALLRTVVGSAPAAQVAAGTAALAVIAAGGGAPDLSPRGNRPSSPPASTIPASPLPGAANRFVPPRRTVLGTRARPQPRETAPRAAGPSVDVTPLATASGAVASVRAEPAPPSPLQATEPRKTEPPQIPVQVPPSPPIELPAVALPDEVPPVLTEASLPVAVP